MKTALIFVLVLLGALASGQTSGTGPTVPEVALTAQPKSEGGQGESVPRTFFGQTFSGQWVFTTAAAFSQEYDDNILSSQVVRRSDNVSRYSIRFGAAVQKKRLRLQLFYYPNYVSYVKFSDRNALSHQYSQDIGYKWSERTDLNWSLFANRAPGYTNSPFQLVNFNGQFLPVFRPDALQSNAIITTANTSATLAHRFSARSTLTVGLQGSAVRFQTDNGVPLSNLFSEDSFSNGATVRWDDEFVPRHKLGVEVGEQYFGFLNPGSHSNYQYVKVRYSQSFGRGYQFSGGAGPSRTERQANNTFASSAQESGGYAVDASLVKAGQRQSLGVTYNHGSQLGLSQGSIASDSVSLSWTRQFGRKWHVESGFGYSRTLGETTILQSTSNSYSTSANITYQLLPQLGVNGGYSYVNQAVVQNLPGGLAYDRNVFTLGLRYNFQWVTSR